MNIDDTLSVYKKSSNRFNAGTATKADHVLLALWDELKAKALAVRELTSKVEMLEMKDCQAASSPEFKSMMHRMNNKATLDSLAG